MMNWDAFGAIAEMLGAAGVMATLVYLAVQVRESNGLARFESHAKARTLIAEHQKLLTDPDHASIWLKGLQEPESLSREQRLRFSNMMYILINSVELTFLNPSGSFQSEVGVADNLGRYPGFRRWWGQARGNFDKEMMKSVDQALERYAADE